MARTKRQKWTSNRSLKRVFEPNVQAAVHAPSAMQGNWTPTAFEQAAPITLELGCGKGEYTLALAKLHPERNFVGVDIKGHRFWYGAQAAEDEGLANAAFLRAKIEFLENHFTPDEVNEIWLPFSDPQPTDERGTKRLTGAPFLARYRRLLGVGGLVHVKTDSPFLHEQTLLSAAESETDVVVEIPNLYADPVPVLDKQLAIWLGIQTTYERRWIERGRTISYLQLRL